MTAQQLKNAILQEAIQGRLVPQDPNDEPASVLLDHIRKEKARLVKEGKLKKKDLEEKPISEDEIPFEIPESWEWCRMSTLFNFIDYRGSTPTKLNSGIPLVTAKNVKKGYNDYSIKDYISLEEYESRKSRGISKKGDLLFTTEAPLGNVSIADLDVFSAGQRLITLQAFGCNLLNNTLMMYFILSDLFQKSLLEKKTGTTVAGIKASKLKDILIPLPPLAEQKRIVAKIEELLPKVEEYGKAQEKLNKLNEELPERLKKSILQEAIEGRLVPQDPNDEPASALLSKIREEKKQLVKAGKLKKKDLEEIPIPEDEIPFEIPESWEWCKLGWIGTWGAGATPAKGNPEFYDKGTIPWLRTGELNNSYVYDSEIKVTEKALEKCSLRMCQKGDVLIAMYGATIGKVAIAGIELTTNQACCACTPYHIYNKYLLYYLLACKKTFIEMGEGGAQPNISREKIIAFPFALPPLAEQHRIVAKIEQLFKEIDKLKK